MYDISIDAGRNLVTIRLVGMLDVDETGAYIADLRRGMVAHRLHAGYRMLLDVSDCKIQTQEMLAAMQAHMAAVPKASAIAIVVGGSLARMQVRRLFAQSYARIVATPREGEAWVLRGIEPGTAGLPAAASRPGPAACPDPAARPDPAVSPAAAR